MLKHHIVVLTYLQKLKIESSVLPILIFKNLNQHVFTFTISLLIIGKNKMYFLF